MMSSTSAARPKASANRIDRFIHQMAQRSDALFPKTGGDQEVSRLGQSTLFDVLFDTDVDEDEHVCQLLAGSNARQLSDEQFVEISVGDLGVRAQLTFVDRREPDANDSVEKSRREFVRIDSIEVRRGEQKEVRMDAAVALSENSSAGVLVEREHRIFFSERIQTFEHFRWSTVDVVQANPPAIANRLNEFGLDEGEAHLLLARPSHTLQLRRVVVHLPSREILMSRLRGATSSFRASISYGTISS